MESTPGERMSFLLRRRSPAAAAAAAANRVIFVGESWEHRQRLLDDPPTLPTRFPDNVVKTSKYEWWSFVPKNLFEQFRRIANCFFLFVAIVQLSVDSPVSPFPSVFSLCFVITVTALKQGFEDYMRHRADKAVNDAPTVVVRDGAECSVRARDVVIGDIVKVTNEQTIPCDMVLLSSINENGSCFVTTANLDGETNLKRIETPPNGTARFNTAASLKDLQAVVECEQPHSDLYKFEGRMYLMVGQKKELIPLNAPNLLVSGSTLKETDFVYGCAAYSGQQTKMALNLKITANKFSTAERTMNKIIVVLIAYLAVEIAACAAAHHTLDDFIIQREFNFSTPTKWSDFLLFLVIFNYVVPVALYVSIEFQKFIGAMFFRWDAEMKTEDGDEWPICNTSDISEELGQINYLFSDKTGTLTENSMEFRAASAGGRRYIMSDGDLLDKTSKEIVTSADEALQQLLINMVMNHTVVVERRGGDLQYKASSPDEKAFVEAAKSVGVVFKGVVDAGQPDAGNRIVDVKGEEILFKVFHILDFDPTRKCMSVIVQNCKTGQRLLMTKGAESSLEPKIVDGAKEDAFRHLEDFAGEGLRTLVFGQRVLSEEEFRDFDARLVEAQTAMGDREKKLSQVYSAVETRLTCVGATGIEDLLQEGVKDTLISLNRAGVHVWVLTGDKKKTAINISFSCGHFDKRMAMHELTDNKGETELREKLEKLEKLFSTSRSPDRHCLVVDGATLTLIERHSLKPRFAEVSRRCSTVLCCRMSPLHKAQIVAMAKNFPGSPVCAAIGDGANDVSMIQEAHLGIGIMGKEGRQAVRCSDFAFSKFRFLKKAVLVHGHWYYYRISVFIMYVIYKNLAYASPQLYYAKENRYSAATLFESIYLQGFNLLFTALPIICYGVMEQNYSKEILLDNPELYRNISRNRYMTIWVFLGWIALAYFHSLIYYYLPYGAVLSGAVDDTGVAALSNWDFGVLVITISVVVINLKLWILTKHWTRWTHVFYWGTMAAFLAFSLIYSATPRSAPVYLSFLQTFSVPVTWLVVFVSVAAAAAPDLVLQTLLTMLERRRTERAAAARSGGGGDAEKASCSSVTPLVNKNRQRNNNSTEMLEINRETKIET